MAPIGNKKALHRGRAEPLSKEDFEIKEEEP
jgi:hypothetical protein